MSTEKLNQSHLRFEGSSCELRVSSLLKNYKISASMLLQEAYQRFACVSQITERFPSYTIVKFYEDDEWSEFPRGYRIALGLCAAFLVKKKVIALKRINVNQSGPAKYQIIDFPLWSDA